MNNITLRCFLLTAIILISSACSHTQGPTKHMLAQAKQDKIYAKKWNKGNSMVQQGYHMVKKGEYLIKEGNHKIAQGTNVMRSCEKSFMENLMEANICAREDS